MFGPRDRLLVRVFALQLVVAAILGWAVVRSLSAAHHRDHRVPAPAPTTAAVTR